MCNFQRKAQHTVPGLEMHGTPRPIKTLGIGVGNCTSTELVNSRNAGKQHYIYVPGAEDFALAPGCFEPKRSSFRSWSLWGQSGLFLGLQSDRNPGSVSGAAVCLGAGTWLHRETQCSVFCT